ncbi:MAG: rRNA pseudouridine synthase, partial [Chitinophagaceae bacterium]|nr:rRNA pseudouridine synthase [Chitinophagaceae bacterium]
MGKSNFNQFIQKNEKGAKLKESIRQEKKKVRQETKEFFSQQKQKNKTGTPLASAEGKRTAAQLITKQAANKEAVPEKDPGLMPLNKYVAHAGICSRRDAAELVKSGKVSVNDTVITEPGFKVGRKDDIKVQGKKVNANKNPVYILLNKPKDHITTTDDPQGRKTVMDIVKKATTERVYPVGRLDRNTT